MLKTDSVSSLFFWLNVMLKVIFDTKYLRILRNSLYHFVFYVRFSNAFDTFGVNVCYENLKKKQSKQNGKSHTKILGQTRETNKIGCEKCKIQTQQSKNILIIAKRRISNSFSRNTDLLIFAQCTNKHK